METVEIKLDDLQRLLDAAHWNIAPYLDEPELIPDHPHIEELMKAKKQLIDNNGLVEK